MAEAPDSKAHSARLVRENSEHRPVRICVAIGSNLGDRPAELSWAVAELTRLLSNARHSAIIETEPQDVPDLQPRYLNAVVVGETSLPAGALMSALLELERRRGRERVTPRGVRTLDLDLIFYGNDVIDGPDLFVPHPRFRSRRFVLAPLVEIDPDWVDPVTGKTAAVLLAELEAKEKRPV